jgi:hypothetical protein
MLHPDRIINAGENKIDDYKKTDDDGKELPTGYRQQCMIPTDPFQQGNAALFNIGPSIFFYKTATVVGAVRAKASVDLCFSLCIEFADERHVSDCCCKLNLIFIQTIIIVP